MLEPGFLRYGALWFSCAREIPLNDVVQVGGNIISGEDEKHMSSLEVAELKDEGDFGFGRFQFIKHRLSRRRQREILLPLILGKARSPEDNINFILAQDFKSLLSGGFRFRPDFIRYVFQHGLWHPRRYHLNLEKILCKL